MELDCELPIPTCFRDVPWMRARLAECRYLLARCTYL